ncbi:hypothetical protein D9V34_15560 [Mycetocola lacteus]|uniref:Uncharacterized protein n=1 Tax=Mycetocola lacteus TaxID=76637 RepID=A0A3L7AHK7_9MICO|nr:hypothetical protein [Mycetocola lacteus]RLP79220.1 hypothetical protein D9V34_15560 [Mycetocola lacteus]
MTDISVQTADVLRMMSSLNSDADDVSDSIDELPAGVDAGSSELTEAFVQIAGASTSAASCLIVLAKSLTTIAGQVTGELCMADQSIVDQLRPIGQELKE